MRGYLVLVTITISVEPFTPTTIMNGSLMSIPAFPWAPSISFMDSNPAAFNAAVYASTAGFGSPLTPYCSVHRSPSLVLALAKPCKGSFGVGAPAGKSFGSAVADGSATALSEPLDVLNVVGLPLGLLPADADVVVALLGAEVADTDAAADVVDDDDDDEHPASATAATIKATEVGPDAAR
jgi:hypothetical protein